MKKAIIYIIVIIIIVGLGIFSFIELKEGKSSFVREETKKEEETTSDEDIKEDEVKEEIDYTYINDVVNKYDLNNIKRYIDEEPGLFIEFSKAIIENNNIKDDYKRYVLLQYKVVISNKKYLIKDSFLDSLRKLKIGDSKDVLVKEQALGVYYDDSLSIVLGKGTKKDVILHELMHFIDYRLGNPNVYDGYKCDEVIKRLYDATNDCIVTNLGFNKLISEGGAEYNSAKYNNDEVVLGHYSYFTEIYNLFVYIFGEDKMNDIFYSNSSVAMFAEEITKLGISYEEYQSFVDGINYLAVESNFVGKLEKTEADYYIEALDFVSDVYKKKFNKSWSDDKIFSFLMQYALWNDYYASQKINDTNFTKEEKRIVNVEPNIRMFNKMLPDKTNSYFTSDKAGLIFTMDGKYYISISSIAKMRSSSLICLLAVIVASRANR